MKAAEFIKKYVEYLYDGTRCFEMDDVYEDENECFEALMEQYESNPEDIRYELVYATKFDPEAADLLKMFDSIEKEENSMTATNNETNLFWWIVDQRIQCQIFVTRLDVQAKEDAIDRAEIDLHYMTESEKSKIDQFFVVKAAADENGDIDLETATEEYTLYKSGYPVAYLNGMEINYNAAVDLMDDDIREELHLEMAPCTNQEFLDAYCKAHYNKYGTDFVI